MAAGDDRRMVRPGITFRVFVSSTFRDFTMERNALQERVWPRLRELCMRHGARFQAIDLRWGVSEEAGQDQRAMEICVEEIRRCQEVTPRPNFIVLLGDRYGWRPLPAIIPQNEFGAILNATTDPDDRALISEWYALDENADPHEYCLRARGETSYDEWGPIEQHLHRVLLDGARAAGLDDAAMVEFERSATEQEIIAGALEARKGNAFGYIRTIEGMPEDERAADFIDMESGLRDPEAKRLMGALKSRLAEHLPEEYRHQITARWDGDGLSEEHLDAFCEQVHQDLERAILEETEKLEAVDELDQEVLAHAEFGRQRRQHFIGREEIIDQVMGYVERAGGYPLIIHGRSGSGKSALMARLAADLQARDVTLITRYIGATPASTQMHSLLQSLCQQTHREFGFAGLAEQWQAPEVGENEPPPTNPYEIPTDPNELRQAFTRFLDLVPENRTLVVVLDALDQLSPENNAHSLHWLPFELPGNVRIIASVLEREDDAGHCHQSAAGRLRERPEALIPLPELSIDQAESILDAWLAEASRFLQPEQRGDVLEKLHACQEGHALFLRLAFEEARRWRSFEPLPLGADDEPGLSDTVPGVIADMLARLEEPANHGRVLVERALGYLRAARHGLAEDEVLQVLSADEEVMANFRERSPFSPEVAGLPAVIWSRLCLDLRPYLAERAADGTSLLSFYHRQVGAVVGERYLGDEGARLEAHRRLEKYFRGQPSWLVTQGAERATNLRKASELVTQQVGGECWDQVEGTLTELEFLEAKVEAGLAFDLAMDFTRCNRALPQDRTWARNLRLLEQALRNDLYFIVLRPLTLFQCFWNSAWWYDSPSAAGHHDPPEDGWGEPGPPWEQPEPKLCTLLERWREGKEARQPGFCWVRSLRPPRFALGGPHVSCMRGHGAEVTGVAFAPDELTVASGSSDGTIRLWSVANGMETACLRTHSPRGQSVAFSPDGARIASGAWDENVRVWDAATGEELACLRSHRSTGLSVAFSPDGTRLASGSSDGTARVWDTSTGEEVACMFGHEGVVRSVAFSPDGARLASGSDDRTVRAWDAATGEEVACMRGHERHVWSLAFSPDGARIVSGSEDGTVRVWDARAGAETACLCAQNAAVHSVALSPDGAWIASGSSDNAVRVWDAATGVELACLRGHEDEVRSVAWSSDARLVSGSDDGTVRLWAWEAAETSGRLRGEGREVTCWALSPDGSCVASGSSDGTLTLWDADSGEQLSVFVEDCPTKYADWRHVERVAWAPTGLRIASGDRDGFIRLWDAHTGLQLTSDCCHNGWVTSLSWSADGEEVFSGSDDGTVRIWDAGCLECLGVDESQDFVGVPQGSDRVDPGHVGPAAGLKLQIRETGVDIAWFPPYLPRLSAQPTRAVWTGGVADYLAIFTLEGDPDAANA